MTDEVTDKIEKNLILLGATAVEDKFQPGASFINPENFPDCIDKLSQAGIKIWVLTGDYMEIAINIGYACRLLRQGMKQITITLKSLHIIAVEKSGEKNAIARVFALIIDRKSLTYALDDDVKDMFLDLAIRCASVICCHSSPKQKALELIELRGLTESTEITKITRNTAVTEITEITELLRLLRFLRFPESHD
ncbi:putative phospholipid-transporting ATPase 11 [Capsicum chinense]|nr:putative phospholipid-transporting ATPase 11 [Capsicum chinense]